jgi:hypothetical protein
MMLGSIRTRLTSGEFSLVMCLALSALVCVTGCGKVQIESAWCAREIKVDGRPDEWQGVTTYIKDSGIAVGAFNDRDNLYVCMSTGDPGIAGRMLRQGLTIWFDREGGKDKILGIRCPIGAEGEAPPRPIGGEGRQDGKRPQRARTASPDSIDMKEVFVKAAAKLEICRPGAEGVIRVENNGELGLEVGLGYLQGRYVYEMKVPLACSDLYPHGIGIDENQFIGAGFEIPKLEIAATMAKSDERGPMPSGGRPDGSSRPSGGVGGGRGRPGGGRGSMGGGRPGAARTAGDGAAGLELWIKIKLASAD